jgi:transcriptional regulator with XRE-family HTH domain
MDIGLEIRLLRERKQITGKELAERIGFSQSQMSRLEKGQRRIDTKLLNKVAEALDVKPSYFFGERDPEAALTEMSAGMKDVGKIIRSERHRLHLTPDELADKIGKTRSYVKAVEEGEIDVVSNDMVMRISRALKLSPVVFFEAQQNTIASLKRQIARLGQTHTESTLGTLATAEFDVGEQEGAETAEGAPPTPQKRRAVPIIGVVAGGYPSEFTADGIPLDDISEFVFVPYLDDDKAFALHCIGDSMEQQGEPSFREGDVVVFSPKERVQNRDFVFARLTAEKPVFRQIIFDPNASIRLQPLNRNYPPITCIRDEIISLHKAVAHIKQL